MNMKIGKLYRIKSDHIFTFYSIDNRSVVINRDNVFTLLSLKGPSDWVTITILYKCKIYQRIAVYSCLEDHYMEVS